jgi:hypothetical protein
MFLTVQFRNSVAQKFLNVVKKSICRKEVGEANKQYSKEKF